MNKTNILKNMWNDISISNIDMKWEIYQKNINNYVLENKTSINLYTIFDYDEKLWNYQNELPISIFNQNIRNLISYKRLEKDSLFSIVEQMEERLNFDELNNTINEFWSDLNLDLVYLDVLKLHYTLKKVNILFYKNIYKLPTTNIQNDFASKFKEDENLYLSFNKNLLIKEVDNLDFNGNVDELIFRYLSTLFWENEKLEDHVALIKKLNFVINEDFEQSMDGILRYYLKFMNASKSGKTWYETYRSDKQSSFIPCVNVSVYRNIWKETTYEFLLQPGENLYEYIPLNDVAMHNCFNKLLNIWFNHYVYYKSIKLDIKKEYRYILRNNPEYERFWKDKDNLILNPVYLEPELLEKKQRNETLKIGNIFYKILDVKSGKKVLKLRLKIDNEFEDRIMSNRSLIVYNYFKT